MSAPDRLVAFVERVATRERIRNYQVLLGGTFLLIGIANYAGGQGRLDATGDVIGADFLAFYTGGVMLSEGRLADAYEPGPDFSFPAQLALQREIVAPQQPPGVHPFVNPPHAALFYLPFTRPGYAAGLAAWWAAGVLALGLSVRRLRNELAGLRTWSSGRLTALCFLFVPTMAWIGYGQVSAFTLWIYTQAFVSLRRGHDAWAGACLGLLAYKPQLALGPAVALLSAGRWRAVLAGAICGSLWLALGVALDPAAARAYWELAPELPQMIRVEGYNTFGVHSLLAFTALLLDPTSPRLAEGVALLLSLGVLGALAASWRSASWRPGSEAWDLHMAATFALGLVVSPHLFFYDLMLLLLPFGILLSHRRALPDEPPLRGGPVLAWTVALWAFCSIGTQLSQVQVYATEAIGLEPRALQGSVLALVGWSYALLREGGRPAG